jgi:hypothetical protein
MVDMRSRPVLRFAHPSAPSRGEVVVSSTSSSTATLSPSDQLEIQTLVARLCHALDFSRPADFVASLTRTTAGWRLTRRTVVADI